MSDSSHVIQRARVTYGRRTRDIDADLSLADTSVVSTGSSVEEPPESDGVDTSTFMDGLAEDEDSPLRVHDDSDTQDPAGTGKFEFGWRKELRKMDDSDDEDVQVSVRATAAGVANDKGKSRSFSEEVEEELDSDHDGHCPLRPGPEHAESSRPTFITEVSSPERASAVPRRAARSRRTIRSDTEEEREPSSPQTPARDLHHLNTPQRHSSPTPPTSTETAPRKGKAAAAKTAPPRFVSPDDGSEEDRPRPSKERNKRSKKVKEKRIKAPTKKEREETEKATARIKAAQAADVPRAQTKIMAIGRLFQLFPDQNLQSLAHSVIPSSDPIESFSSSPRATAFFNPRPSPPAASVHLPRTVSLPSAPSGSREFPAKLEDSDDELPDLANAIKQREEENEARKRSARMAELVQRKQRLLEQQQQRQVVDESSDDGDIIVTNDMHTIAQDESEQRRRQRLHGQYITKNQRELSKVRPIAARAVKFEEPGESSLQIAAVGAFGTPAKKKRGKGDARQLKPAELNEILRRKMTTEAQKVTEEKERVWRSMGGHVSGRPNPQGQAKASEARIQLLQRGLRNIEQDQGQEDVQLSDESDQEWRPDDEQTREDEDAIMVTGVEKEVDGAASVDEGEGDEDAIMLAPKHRARARIVAVTDSDDEENIAPRGSSEENAENETDKENNATLMFDQGEDKENTSIHFSPTPPSPPLGLFQDSRIGRTLSLSSDFGDHGPLRDIAKDDDPFLTPSARMPPPGALSLDLGLEEQVADPENPFCLKPAPILDAGFSQLFEASAGSSSKIKSFSQFITPAKGTGGLKDLRKPGGLVLPLSFNPSLQPALEVTDSVRKKADNIFEKEQEYMAGDEEPAGASEPQMFVNENGFLTQTRPSNMDVARLMSSTQSTRIGVSPSILDSIQSRATQRRPLGEIELDIPGNEKRPGGGRLKRRRASPDRDGGYSSSGGSPSPSPIKRPIESVFAQMKEARNPLKKPKFRRSDFVNDQAQESDEEEHFGFGERLQKQDQDDDDEDNAEELQKLRKEMVDDAAMDETTLNEEKVLEKHRQQVEADDAVEMKIAQDAATGKLRVKQRSRGVGYEDDEDSDEDEENEARRYKMMRRHRELGDADTLVALGKDKESAPFVESYQKDLDDDNQEFSYLNESQQPTLVEKDEGDEDEDEEEDRQVTMAELRKELQGAAQGRTTVDAPDPQDLSWLDQGDDDMVVDDTVAVKEVTKVRTGSRSSGRAEWDLERPLLRRGDADTPALAQVKQLLHKSLRITIDDGRIFLGTFAGTDKQLNILLINADEFRLSPLEHANPNGRFVGLVMVPRRMIVRVEAPLTADGGGERDMYA
ncbi:hypothetical protein EUX98_g570 [Antrodiella citrinella]|uniref:Sm domain-containing protein n=1 Tax=Antrodiella citrinella TaxID=2447956 RepID=A0A4S4N3K4_9APHY|nr:hypothetical protein EUX98_g570 [Antrodiella citrinella]